MGIAPSTNSGDVEMSESADTGGLPENVLAQIDATHQKLSAVRKKRKIPEGYVTQEEVKTFTAKHTIPSLHSSSPAGITALAVSKNNNHFLTGGNDKVVQLYDRESDKVLASLKAHQKKINHVAFREADGEPTLLLSGGADKIAKAWSHDEASGEYKTRGTIRHKGEITGLVVHPTSTLLALSSADRTYSLHDLNTFQQVYQSPESDEPFTTLNIHPDGQLLAAGTPSSTIQIFDIRSGTIAVTLTPSESIPFTVNTLSFSENGYHLLAPDSLSSVGIWDLRKSTLAHSIKLGDGFKTHKVLYDYSARMLSVAGSDGVRVFAHKSWEELVRFEEAGDVIDLVYGVEGKEIWGASGRDVRIWGLPA